MSGYLLSVRFMCYNQEQFVRSAMEGILRQVTDFPFELVIGDDYSTDATLKILKEYKGTDKIHIKILERKQGDQYWINRQKKGRLYNFSDIIHNCSGKYIALIDGDDYWTDPEKLQIQVSFLEENPDYSSCFHQVYGLYKENIFKDFNSFETDKTLGFEDLVKKNIIATSSCVFRRYDFYNNMSWIHELPAADWGIHLKNAREGKIRFLGRNMGVYRIHEEGLWNKLSHYERVMKGVDILKRMNEHFEYHFNPLFQDAIKERMKELVPRQDYKKTTLFSKIKNVIKRTLFSS